MKKEERKRTNKKKDKEKKLDYILVYLPIGTNGKPLAALVNFPMQLVLDNW